MTLSRNMLIMLVAGALLLAAAAYMLFGRSSPEAALSSDAPASTAEAKFLSLTAQIEPVGFNTGILSDPRFMALQDIRVAILPELSGRIDPFAPLP